MIDLWNSGIVDWLTRISIFVKAPAVTWTMTQPCRSISGQSVSLPLFAKKLRFLMCLILYLFFSIQLILCRFPFSKSMDSVLLFWMLTVHSWPLYSAVNKIISCLVLCRHFMWIICFAAINMLVLMITLLLWKKL